MTRYETLTNEYASAGAKIQIKMAHMIEFTTNFLGGFAVYIKVPNQRCLESQFQIDAPRNRVVTRNQLHVSIDGGSSVSIVFQVTVSMDGTHYVVATVSGETAEGGTFTIVTPDDTAMAYENIYQTMLLHARSQYGEQN